MTLDWNVTTREKIIEELNDKISRVRAEKAEVSRMGLTEAFKALVILERELEQEITYYEN